MHYPGLASCLNCGSFFARQSLLCLCCEQKISKSDFFGMQQIADDRLCIYSLFEWMPGESDILSGLLIALKGSQQKQAWNFWAALFWQERVVTMETEEQLCFLPAPSTRSGADHGYFFAQEFAKLTGGQFLPTLTKTNQKHQRKANRESRSGIQISSAVKIAGKDSLKRYILIDDVLTTGATARACYRALGNPPNFEVWVLGKRSLSCDPLVDLL